ncbi:hypothetical protein CK203_008040 [Vitis vinifera]|uniref:Retrotransposon Copia-like N-terminal domain-containing protein n=1 Tax=Vitis vinifera TaxID=29760 RepID=A0A438K1X2_VITVI|nr:hypothetical protein CK203_008040 [Vitis vinifera]
MSEVSEPTNTSTVLAFETLATHVLGKRKLSHLVGKRPNLSDLKFHVWDEEDSMIMSWLWNSMVPKINTDALAMVSNRNPTMLSIGGQIRFPTMGMAGQICPNNWCNCYKKPGHGKDRCLKLHGKLPNFGKNRKSKGGQQDTGEFNKEEIEKLRSLLGTLAKPLGACSLALAGATNHMTNSSLKFSIYSPYPSNIKITTADGSLTTVVDQGLGLGEDDVTC